MNKKELICALSDGTELKPGDAEAFLKCFETVVLERLKIGDEVKLSGFGTFYMKTVNGRVYKTPGSNTEVRVQAGTKPAFRFGGKFNELFDKEEN